MKNQYERSESTWRCYRKDAPDWSYICRWTWGRMARTAQHCRQFVLDEYDIRHCEETPAFKQRRRRNAYRLDRRSLEPRVARSNGKSWKDYTKNSHQWMDKKVRHERR